MEALLFRNEYGIPLFYEVVMVHVSSLCLSLENVCLSLHISFFFSRGEFYSDGDTAL